MICKLIFMCIITDLYGITSKYDTESDSYPSSSRNEEWYICTKKPQYIHKNLHNNSSSDWKKQVNPRADARNKSLVKSNTKPGRQTCNSGNKPYVEVVKYKGDVDYLMSDFSQITPIYTQTKANNNQKIKSSKVNNNNRGDSRFSKYNELEKIKNNKNNAKQLSDKFVAQTNDFYNYKDNDRGFFQDIYDFMNKGVEKDSSYEDSNSKYEESYFNKFAPNLMAANDTFIPSPQDAFYLKPNIYDDTEYDHHELSEFPLESASFAPEKTSKDLQVKLFSSPNASIILPKPYPNCPPLQSIDNRLLVLLSRLNTKKKIELKVLVKASIRALIAVSNRSLIEINTTLVNNITSENSALQATISSLFSTSQNTLLGEVLSTINTSNNAALIELNALINQANASIQSNIVTLSTQTSAVIVSTIQDLTTIAGTLQQILAIMTDLSNKVNTLFTDTFNKELVKINSLFGTSENDLLSSISAAVLSSQSNVLKLVTEASNNSYKTLSHLFKKYMLDLGIVVESFLKEYSNEINRHVICSFTSNN